MTALTVWRFDSPYGARNALDLLERLRKEDLLQLDDAAIVRGRRTGGSRRPNNYAAWPG
jgi:uncharacterized membrane protein